MYAIQNNIKMLKKKLIVNEKFNEKCVNALLGGRQKTHHKKQKLEKF